MKKRATKNRFAWFNSRFAFKFIFVSFLWFLTHLSFDMVKDIQPLKTFVPNEILGISMQASISEVKKAYRQLSKEKHPDKNPDNPEAISEFI
jgi:preprotein translocase subunit Sec63